MQALSGARLALPAPGKGCGRPAHRAPLRVQALAVPDAYGWVMASAALTAAVTQWQAIRVGLARRECGIKYPQMYAEGTGEDAMKFNCTQRAHQNTLETLPNVLALQMLLGLAYPQVAAGLGTAWALARIGYTLGYATGDPAKRVPASVASSLIYLALILVTAAVGLKTATGL